MSADDELWSVIDDPWDEMVDAIPDEALRIRILKPFRNIVHRGAAHQNGDADQILRTCARICKFYDFNLDEYRRTKQNMTKKELKSQLENVSSSVRRLQTLLKDRRLLNYLLLPKFDEDPRGGEVLVDIFAPEWIKNGLSKLEARADELLKDPAALDYCRGNVDHQWSADRTLVWEPYFELVADMGLKVPVSRNGPVMNAIRALHAAISAAGSTILHEPPVESVLGAMKAFSERYGVARGEN